MLGNVVQIAGTELEIQFAPIIFLGDVVDTKLNPVIPPITQVLIGVNNFVNLAIRTAYYRLAREVPTGRRQVNDFLRLNRSDYVMLINLEPIKVGGKTVCPVTAETNPPAV